MAERSRKRRTKVLAMLACIALVMGLMPIPALADPAEAPAEPSPNVPSAEEPADETSAPNGNQAQGAGEAEEPASPTKETTKSDEKAPKTTEKRKAASSAKGAGDSKPKLIITAKDQTYTYNGSTQGEGDPVYGDNIDSKITVEGLQSGDKITMIVIDGALKEVGSRDLVVSGCSITDASGKSVKENYEIEYVKGTLTIEKKPVTVTTGKATKKYDGKALTNTEAKIEGLVNGETATVTATGSRTNAGSSDNTYSIKWGDNTNENNYKVKENLGTLIVERAKATITVNDASKMAGKPDPVFTGTVKGLVKDGDLGTVKYVRTGDDEAPGTYKGVLTAKYTNNTNYSVKVVKGNFTIKGKPCTLTFDLAGGKLDGKTGTMTIAASVGDTIEIPKAPTRDGYTFKYWKGSEYRPGDKYKVEGNHKFTAVWEKTATKPVSKSSTPRTGDPMAGSFMPLVALAAISGLCLALSGTALRRCRDLASSGKHVRR